MKNRYFFLLILTMCSLVVWGKGKVYEMSSFGILPDTKIDNSPFVAEALQQIKSSVKKGESVVLSFAAGKYHFYPANATEKEYYISNHDQDNPKKVGLSLEGWENLTLEGNGAEFIFHGQMLPISLLHSSNCTLQNLSIDFENPHIAQVQIVENKGKEGMVFRVAPWVKYRITSDSLFEAYGEGWKQHQNFGIAFEEKTKRIVYNTSDISISTKGLTEIAPDVLYAPDWKDERLIPGTVVAMRTWERPTPGIFLSHDKDTKLKNIKVHYSQGMGLLAQLCENISLDGFSVCLRGTDDPRYFTTQADATHFSQCRGKIVSVNGLYEGMMDDAINVHGTYLKVIKRIDDHTVVGRYMHGQAWGFDWGYAGDKVQFLRSKTMDLLDGINEIVSIVPLDKDQVDGAREFKITFVKPLDKAIDGKEAFGMENLTWTPEVYFANNLIRNNRARGSLFSTPRKTVVENNIFDHTSGSAILLCGDCNGWYETGACRNVLIRKNKFVNALTNMFQFTTAVISIYPEIPDLANQQTYFHGGKKGAIRIVDNEFDTFDNPVLYAKSVNGLVFKGNVIRTNADYKAFHPNKKRFLLERVIHAEIEE